jgi:DNA-binding NtrC family response regulator
LGFALKVWTSSGPVGLESALMDFLPALIGESPGIVTIREKVKRLFQHSSDPRRLPPILILGEVGTGKSLLARALHHAGPRRAEPFITVNCPAIPDRRAEAELFGFERDASTAGRQPRSGLLQAANGGSIFLEEIGVLPLELQGKLLTVIEERTVQRLGSTAREHARRARGCLDRCGEQLGFGEDDTERTVS